MRTLAEVDQKLIIATCVCSTSKLNKTTNPGPDCGKKKKILSIWCLQWEKL